MSEETTNGGSVGERNGRDDGVTLLCGGSGRFEFGRERVLIRPGWWRQTYRVTLELIEKSDERGKFSQTQHRIHVESILEQKRIYVGLGDKLT